MAAGSGSAKDKLSYKIVVPHKMKTLATIYILCLATTAVAADDLAISPLFFTNQGYRVVSSQVLEPTEWEKKEFNLVQKSVTQIKSIAQVPLKDTDGQANWYYRFTIIVEQYADADQATKRLPKIDTPPPRNPHAEPDKAFPLRKGFQQGNKVYVIATDVSMHYFDGPLDKVKKAIEEQVTKEAQPSAAPLPRAPQPGHSEGAR
ncbi:MAG: hypothetical protein C0404_07130 [Verrucomicrobia bacterium]|nr:hypothetical protein [Verrucomicrobiota bacterium]